MSAADFEAEPPRSDVLTSYDERHLVTYLRLLDAHAEGADWREVCTIVLGLDPVSDPERARSIHASHLARAQWLVTTGYRALLDKARHT